MRQPHVRLSVDTSTGDRHDVVDGGCHRIGEPQRLVDTPSTYVAFPAVAISDLINPYLFDKDRRETFVTDAYVSGNLLGMVELPLPRFDDGTAAVSGDASPLRIAFRELLWVRCVVGTFLRKQPLAVFGIELTLGGVALRLILMPVLTLVAGILCKMPFLGLVYVTAALWASVISLPVLSPKGLRVGKPPSITIRVVALATPRLETVRTPSVGRKGTAWLVNVTATAHLALRRFRGPLHRPYLTRLQRTA
jgi:hypothetical protein